MGLRWVDDGDQSPAANALTPLQAVVISGWSPDSLIRSIDDGSVRGITVGGAFMIDGRSLAAAMRPRDRCRIEWTWDAQRRFEAEQRAAGLWEEPTPSQPETPKDARDINPIDLYRRDFLGGIR